MNIRAWLFFIIVSLSSSLKAATLEANYLFQEESWPTANSVLDSSGNNQHGSPIGGVTPVSSSSCGMLDVPPNFSASQYDAVDTELDINKVGNDGSISFWYKSNLDWSNSAKRVLFDASTDLGSNDKSKYFFLMLESGKLTFGVEDKKDNDGVLNVSNLNFAADEWVHIVATWNIPNDHLELYVNGSLLAALSSVKFSGGLGSLDTLYLGDNRSNYVVFSSGNSANGQFHNVRIYNVDLKQSDVTADYGNSPNCVTILPPPISHWPLDVCSFDGTPGEVIDVISGANGQSVDGADIVVEGKLCQAGDFAGNGQHINVPHSANFEVSEGSIAFWFKTPDLSHSNDTSSGGMGLFSKDSNGTDNGGDHLTIWANANGSIFVRHQDTSNSYEITSASGLIGENNWHHIVYTFGSRGMHLFIDGELRGSNSYIGGLASNPEPIILASNAWSSSNNSSPSSELHDHFIGQMDDIRLYNQALNAEQVLLLKGEVSTGCESCVINDVLEAHWPVDMCSLLGENNVLLDIVNQYNGTSVDFAGVEHQGKFCQAGKFSGSGDHFHIPNQTAFETNEGAISFWFNTPDLGYSENPNKGGQALFSKDSNGFDNGGHLSVWLQATGRLHVRHQSSSQSYDIYSNVNAQVDTWNHLVYSWGPKGMTLYLNGVVVATNSSATVGLSGNQEPIILGAGANISADNNSEHPDLRDYFQGQMDDIRFYSNQINSSTVNALYNQASYTCNNCNLDPILQYRFEGEEWADPGSVLDTSGYNRHGSVVNLEGSQAPDQQVSCRVLDIARNPNNTNYQAVDTGIDINSVGPKGGISFWYRSNLDWSDGELRILFDASTSSGTSSSHKYFLMYVQNGNLLFAVEDSNGREVVFGLANVYFEANQWVHIGASWNLPEERLEVFLNGYYKGYIYNTGFSNELAEFDTLYIGNNRNPYIAVSGGNSANGQFDDFRVYDGIITFDEMQRDMANVERCEFVDHYRLIHDGQGLTCDEESVTIKACLDESCSQLYEQSSVVEITPINGNIEIAANASTTASFRETTQTTVSFTMQSELPVSANGLRCFDGLGNETCDLSFTNAGFEWFGQNVGDAINDQIAEAPFDYVNLRAVKDVDGVCVAQLQNTTQAVNLERSCVTPGSCKTPVMVGSTALDPSSLVNLSFDADGVANIPDMSYADAGLISLNASATLDDGSVIESGNQQVQVYPASLSLTQTDDTSNYPAGVDFNWVVQALGANGTVLKNYQPGNLQLKLTSNTGPALGDFTYASGSSLTATTSNNFTDLNVATFTDGEYRFAANFSEMDTLTVDIRDSNYAGHQITTDHGDLTMGTFVPAYFEVEVTTSPSFSGICPTDGSSPQFVYFGQPFGFASTCGAGVDPQLTLTARNGLGNIATNYRGSAWNWLENHSDLANITFSDPGFAGTISLHDAGISEVSDVGTAPVEYGRQHVTLRNAQLIYNKPDDPLAPLPTSANMVIPASLFTDPNISGHTLCGRSGYTPGNPGSCENLTISTIGGTEQRWGRLKLQNAFGPENETILAEVRTEYFDGNTFVRNLDDSFTATSLWPTLSFEKTNSAQPEYPDVTSMVNVSANFSLLQGRSQGIEGIAITPPMDSSGNYQRGQIRLELLPVGDSSITWDDYLQFDWDGSATPGMGNPSATITFGQFRGNDRIIYWREIY